MVLSSWQARVKNHLDLRNGGNNITTIKDQIIKAAAIGLIDSPGSDTTGLMEHVSSTTRHNPTVSTIKGLLPQIRSKARRILVEKYYGKLSPGERVWLMATLVAGKASVSKEAWSSAEGWKVDIPSTLTHWIIRKTPMLKKAWYWRDGTKRQGKPRTPEYFTQCSQSLQHRLIRCPACGIFNIPGYCNCGTHIPAPKRRKKRPGEGKNPYSVPTFIQGSLHPTDYKNAHVKPAEEAGAFPGVRTMSKVDSGMYEEINIILGGEVDGAWRSFLSNLTNGERWSLHIEDSTGISQSQVRRIRYWYGRISRLSVLSRHVLYLAVKRYEVDGERVLDTFGEFLSENVVKSVLRELRKCGFGERVITGKSHSINFIEDALQMAATYDSLKKLLIDRDGILNYCSVYSGQGAIQSTSPGIWSILSKKKPRDVARDAA